MGDSVTYWGQSHQFQAASNLTQFHYIDVPYKIHITITRCSGDSTRLDGYQWQYKSVDNRNKQKTIHDQGYTSMDVANVR